MLRITIFGLLASLFALAHALPPATRTTDIIERREAKKGYNKPPKYKPSPPQDTNCPTTQAFHIQQAADSMYATLQSNPVAGVDSFIIAYTQPDALLADPFTFVKNSDGTCQLSILPTSGITSTVGFHSSVFDQPGSFADPHIFFIKGPAPNTSGYQETPIYCKTDSTLTLLCYTTDGSTVEPVLSTSDEFFAIGNDAVDFRTTYNLVPVV